MAMVNERLIRITRGFGAAAMDGSEDVISGLGPAQGFGALQASRQARIAASSGVEGWTPRRGALSVSRGKTRSTWLSQDAEVWLQGTSQRCRLANQSRIGSIFMAWRHRPSRDGTRERAARWLDVVEELTQLGGAMALDALAHDRAGGGIGRRRQRGRAEAVEARRGNAVASFTDRVLVEPHVLRGRAGDQPIRLVPFHAFACRRGAFGAAIEIGR